MNHISLYYCTKAIRAPFRLKTFLTLSKLLHYKYSVNKLAKGRNASKTNKNVTVFHQEAIKDSSNENCGSLILAA